MTYARISPKPQFTPFPRSDSTKSTHEREHEEELLRKCSFKNKHLPKGEQLVGLDKALERRVERVRKSKREREIETEERVERER